MRSRWAIEIVVAILLLGIGATSAVAQERSLYWKSLAVEARLDADGRLHVREVQEMVFTGAWNGGERRFRLGPGQGFELTGLYELDPDGTRREFKKGSLTRVGEYRWVPDKTLRWRSRLPQDAPFDRTARTYEIDYVLSRIVTRTESGYLLNHDFAFADRSGPVQEFSRTLELDPSWQFVTPVETTLRRASLQPGMSDVERIELQYVGAGKPAAVAGMRADLAKPGPHQLAVVLVGALAALIVCYAVVLFSHEQSRGRYASLVPIETIDDAWLDENVFKWAPEVVGATWDRRTSTHEVAAVLARMTAEGKLSSRVQSEGVWIFHSDVLHLDLTCDPASLPEYERKLIEKLFLGKRSTSTKEIREHYRKSGFDPLAVIRPTLEQKVNRVLGADEKPARWHWVLTLTLIATGIVVNAAGAILWPPSVPFTAIATGLTLLPMFIAKMRGYSYRDAPTGTFSSAGSQLVLVTAGVVVLAWAFSMPAFELTALSFVGLTLFAAGLVNSVYNSMRSRESREAVEIRNRLASARRYLAHELASKSPRLKDSWLPYILGFGLGPNVDRWFKSYGAPGDSGVPLAGSSSGGSFSSSASHWTGGGGTFGGAGASGTWVSALGGLAGGVTAASSSSGSSGGGGGGGGGSSGGGGGGGW
jgi:uncharacterized membrane protein YgcG